MTDNGARICFFLALCCTISTAGIGQNAAEPSAALAAEGQQAMAHGDYTTAEEKFQKLAQLDPGVAEIHATLAVICFKRREYERAVTEIRVAQRLKPGLPNLDSLLGLSLAEEDKFADALPHLEKGFHQTADAEVRRQCGLELLRVYSNLGRDADAVETSLTLNKAYPNDPEVLYHTGRVYGSYAYTVMEKLHDTAPGSIWMLQAQGEANESQRNWDAAIVAFNHVLAIDANRPGIHYRLGRVYLGRFRDSGNPPTAMLRCMSFLKSWRSMLAMAMPRMSWRISKRRAATSRRPPESMNSRCSGTLTLRRPWLGWREST